MKKQMLLAIAAITVLFAASAALSDWSQTADATKATGVNNSQYGKNTKNIVCGDKLCSEVNQKQAMTSMTSQSDFDIKTMMDKMNSIHEKHQEQMMEMWNSMSLNEQSQMAQKMQNMIEKMESKDMHEHMAMMSDKDHQDHDKKKHGDYGEKKHGDYGEKKHGDSHGDKKMHQQKLYDPDLNPRQTEYPAIQGFNDLHIEAIRHVDPNTPEGVVEHLLNIVVHHHCKVYDDMTAACLLFPTGMNDQDKPYGIEYVISAEQYGELPQEEQMYWHYHLTEFPRAKAAFPDLTSDELTELQPILDETYGKVYYFWNYLDKYPMGEPTVLVIQDLPEQ